MTQRLVILGAGGNCFDIVDAVQSLNAVTHQYEIDGFLDDDPDTKGAIVYGYPVLGSLGEAGGLAADTFFVNGIGSPHSYLQKPECIRRTEMAPERFATIVHPAAAVSPSASLGAGTVVLGNATICAGATVGNHAMILPNCVISHDCVVNDYAIMAAGAVLCGNVTLAPSCYVGAATVILGGLTVSSGSLVGAGSVVTRNVPANSVVCGNPARIHSVHSCNKS